MGTSSNAEVAMNFFIHISKGDMAAALDLMDENSTWWTAGRPEQFPLAGTYNKRQFVDMLNRLGKNMPNGVSVTITSVTAQEEQVVVEAEVLGVNAHGKTYDNQLVYALELRNGLILRVREYLDTLHANEVLVGD